MIETRPETALKHVATQLRKQGRAFALVGGLGVSIRGEVRFTRDLDLAIATSSDTETEGVVRELVAVGYKVLALVEHDERKRLATVRLRSPTGIVVDLLAASSGIEAEVVARAEPVTIDDVGSIPVARAEELLALKILSATEQRPQDRIDAVSLVVLNQTLDVAVVRELVRSIHTRGFDRGQDLEAKLDALLASVKPL